MKCQHCGSAGRIMVQTVITAPGELYRQFAKSNLRSKEVQLNGTLWETCDFICGNVACGRVTNGYGNHVTNLEKKARELEARVVELEKERDHWKANHDAQVQRARVLIERPDMPFERTRAYQDMEKLQRFAEVQKTLLGAFSGQLAAPADEDPCGDDAPGLEKSAERVRAAFCVQQPAPVPDQMALVWRCDLIRLWSDRTHKRAYFDNTMPKMQKIRAAIDDYHFALDSHAHGGVAQDRAFNAICNAMGMHWERGKESARRAEALSGQSNQPHNEPST